MIARKDSWNSSLQKFILASRNKPLSYGIFDCMLFLADAVQAMTDVDLAEDFRGQYFTYEGGMQLLRRHGIESFDDLILKHLGRTPIALAHVGDVVLATNREGIVGGGIIQGEGIYVLNERGGISTIPRSQARVAFHIPFKGEV